MNTKIGTSFGLALLLALGVLATMLALGMFSSPKANADVDVTAVASSPTTPGATAGVTIDFLTITRLIAGSDQIRVKFDKNWTVPSTIAKERITITTAGTTGGTSNPAIDPSIEVDGTTSDITVILTVGDTNPAEANVQNLQSSPDHYPVLVGTSPGTTVHKIVFSPLAGIKNPIVAAAAADSNNLNPTNWVAVTTTRETTQETLTVQNAFAIVRTLTLNSESGPNGTTITVTGKGFTSGTSASVFADADSGSDFDSTELVLASGVAITGGEFTATVLVNTTQFPTAANQISAFDGTGATATFKSWTLTGSVTTSKTSVKRGESLVIKLRQFFGNGLPQVISIGGSPINTSVPCSGCSALGVPVSGSADYTVTVNTTTPLGTQRVSVTSVGEAARTVNIEVVGAPLTLSPSTAVPEQEINVSGSGFTVSSTVPPTTGVTVQGTAIASANIAGGTTPATDSSGNVNFQVKIESTATTRTAGSYELQVIDASGRTGSATLTIPSRVVTLSPTSSRRGTTVTATGTGFPAKQTVTLTYGSTTVASVTPDSVGAFSTTFEVPNGAGIPSSNTVTATSSGTSTPTGTATHAVPGATIAVSPSSVASGQNITVTAEGFPGFASMTALSVGGVSAIPTPAPATGSDGSKTTTALVPALSLGPQTVSVTIGSITGTSSVTIVAAPVVPVVTTTATGTVFADVVASADNLVRVWRYSNATQAWAFYDPRTAFAAANTLTTTTSKDIVWVNVKVNQTFQGQTLFAGWNLISLN